VRIASIGNLGKVEFDLIDEAPTPGLTDFQGLHDRMFRRTEMFGGVFVLGRIAAADMPASHTQTQMNPLIARLQTLLAPVGSRRDILDLIRVGTLHGITY
jgi:hypothetical protein